jgi:TctA family transporter
MLGPLVESSFFQALAIGRGSFAVFVATPTSILLWLAVAAALVLHLLNARTALLPRLGRTGKE